MENNVHHEKYLIKSIDGCCGRRPHRSDQHFGRPPHQPRQDGHGRNQPQEGRSQHSVSAGLPYLSGYML